jgi:hypothetical protein
MTQLPRLHPDDRALLERLCAAVERLAGCEAAPPLAAALADYFGIGSRFTVAGLLELVDTDPHGEVAAAVAGAVDINASPRAVATALGRLLASAPWCERVDQSRGSAVYTLRT